MTKLSNANVRFKEGIKAHGLDITVELMSGSTRTAEEAANACGCAVGQIVKSLIFQGAETSAPYLLLVSGANRVNEKNVASSIGEKLKRPDADYVREVTGYAIGGIPPLAHKTPLKTYFDKDLLAFETVWAAAGTPSSIFQITPADLCKAADAKVIDVS